MPTFRAQLSVTVFIFSFMANELNVSVVDYQTYPGSWCQPASQLTLCFGERQQCERSPRRAHNHVYLDEDPKISVILINKHI